MRTTLSKLTKPVDESQARVRRKEQTRHNLMQAALELVGKGSSYTALGIREITREAGVVPTAFYRHFKTTDELGLALVEESGLTLRRLLREARQARWASAGWAVLAARRRGADLVCMHLN